MLSGMFMSCTVAGSGRLRGASAGVRRRLALLATVALVAGSVAFVAPAVAEVAPMATITLPGSSSLSGSYLAARYAGRTRDMAAAAAFYDEALAADPDNPQLIERAFTLRLASGDIDGALALVDLVPPRLDGNNLATLARAAQAFERGRYAAARELIARKGRTQLAEITAALTSAWSYAGEKNEEKAFAVLDDLRGTDLDLGFSDYHSGLIADLLGDHVEARRRLAVAYDGEPGMLRIAEAYARALARDGSREKALEVIDGYLARIGPHPLLTGLRDEIADGQTPAPLVADASAGLSEALYDLGSAISREGSEEAAAAFLELALYLNENSDLAALALAGLHERLSQPEEAIDLFKRIKPDSPHAREAQIQIGLNLNDIGQLDEAKKTLGALVARDPSDLEAVIAYGSVLRAHDQFAEAAAAYTAGIDTLKAPDRRHWVLFYQRAICYERLKEWPKAEADFKHALALSPDQPLALNYLGYSWVDMGLNLDEAVRMIRKAVDLRPTDGYIVDSLGWAYFRLGQYDEAVAELERAVELLPDDPVINDHLGDAYWATGRRLEAKFQWAHARDMKPEAAALAAIQDKLANGLPPTTPTKASSNATGAPAAQP